MNLASDHVDRAERRARLGQRHFLAVAGSSIEDVADGMVGLHSSDPITPYLSLWARVAGVTPDDIGDALYTRRALIRVHAMRRTLFVVGPGLASTMAAACTNSYVARERAKLVKLVEQQGLAADGAAWVDRVATATVEALRVRGEATAVQLTADVPELALRLSFGSDRTWAGTVGVSTRILFLLATQSRIARGQPVGTWVSGQYRWLPMDSFAADGFGTDDPEEARQELVRRWLATYGPGTTTDVQSWTGWTKGQTMKTLAALEAVEVDPQKGSEQPWWLLADDLTVEDPHQTVSRPWVALLPGLDPTVMGWKQRQWYVGNHAAALFDRNGNAGPTVWANGRIIGGWSQAKGGDVRVQLLEQVSTDVEDAVSARAGQLGDWLGATRITHRFRSPLDIELASG